VNFHLVTRLASDLGQTCQKWIIRYISTFVLYVSRRLTAGMCIHLVGGTIAYKCKFQPTVAGSSTDAEFMAACNVGKMVLFVRSILWDLNVLQEAVTLLYEDNDGCTAMGNAQKPTP
jgi:hypothetical protein